MRKWTLFVLGLVVFVGFAAYFFYQSRKISTTNLVYNTFSQEWEAASPADNLDREVIRQNQDNSDGLHNNTIVRGYFERYDEDSQTLHLRSIVPFTRGNLYEPLAVKLSAAQTIYCAPGQYTDPNTGKSYQTSKLTIPVKDGQTIYLPTERVLSLETFLTQSTDLTYLIIQLTRDLTKTDDNYLQKLIAIGLCN